MRVFEESIRLQKKEIIKRIQKKHKYIQNSINIIFELNKKKIKHIEFDIKTSKSKEVIENNLIFYNAEIDKELEKIMKLLDEIDSKEEFREIIKKSIESEKNKKRNEDNSNVKEDFQQIIKSIS
jgi:hypothetical protein